MPPSYQKTLAIITPNLLRQTEAIIESSSLAILNEKQVQLSSDQVHQFLQQANSNNSVHNDDPKSANSVHNEDLKSALTSGPVHVLIIGGLGAVSRWLELIGQVDQANCISVLYGSADIGAASRDVRFFFPGTLLEVDYSRSAREYLSETLREVLVKGLVSMSKARPENPVLWLGMWLLENKPHEM